LVLSNGIAEMIYIDEDVGEFFDNPFPALLSRWYQVDAIHFSDAIVFMKGQIAKFII
jgi:hypothetical protein